MAYVFKLPDIGEGLQEAEIIKWLISQGDAVAEDQPMVEVQTDKAIVEIPSPTAGTVLKIHAADGEVIPVGAAMITIGEAGEAIATGTGDETAAKPESSAPPALPDESDTARGIAAAVDAPGVAAPPR
ncbi:MAG: biotin/lipoyl-containing protein, partial [Thermaerobacterales bacterium]